MSILDKKHILTIDLDDSSIEYSKKIFFYNTDKNISNLYVKIKKNNDDGVGVELSLTVISFKSFALNSTPTPSSLFLDRKSVV